MIYGVLCQSFLKKILFLPFQTSDFKTQKPLKTLSYQGFQAINPPSNMV